MEMHKVEVILCRKGQFLVEELWKLERVYGGLSPLDLSINPNETSLKPEAGWWKSENQCQIRYMSISKQETAGRFSTL